jgi:hypothetical protein
MSSKAILGISILLLLFSILSSAQSDPVNRRSGEQPDFKFSYNSSLIYPGMSVGIEIPVPSVRKRKLMISPEGNASDKDWFISGNLNWYHHPEFHDNLYLTAEWVKRRTKSSGFISEFSYGPGLSRTFNGGTTYTVNDNGNISVLKLAGFYYALLTIGWGCGYDFSVNRQQPFSVLVKGNMLIMFPYNSTIYFRPVLEFGFRYMPFIKISKVQKQHDSISKQK